ncbi:MAG TPA: hypothetical protein VG184_01015 [Acidimicrobiales bacterium]|nr:hypothetical protein [Acidimicrobiales bacterium]
MGHGGAQRVTQLRYSTLLLAGTIVGLAVTFLGTPAALVAGIVTGHAPAALAGAGAWLVMAATYLPIGSQGRGARNADPVPHPPFNPYVRFSRIRLTDGLLDMVTLPSGNG